MRSEANVSGSERGEVGDNVDRVSAVSVGNCKQAANVV